MGFSTWWLYLWPGLPGLWLRGQIRGLCVAILFTLLLNLALVATFVWPEWVPFALVIACWALAAVIWISSAWNSHYKFAAETALPKNAASLEAQLVAAQGLYLRRHWLEAESALSGLAEHAADDRTTILARLMLAALFRRTERWSDAQQQLDYLANLPERGKWDAEIRREQARLTDLQRERNRSELGESS